MIKNPTSVGPTSTPSGAGLDVDAPDMPQDGVVEVHDSDDELLAEEKSHKISDIPGPADQGHARRA